MLAAGGGALAAAIAAGILLNLRYVPMGIALAPSLRGSAWRRAATGQAMIDFSWAAASRGGGRFDPWFMLGATLPSYPCWVGGTVIGVYAGDLIGDPAALGLDVLFPAFFLCILVEGELRPGLPAAVAAIGAAIAFVLTPITPAGVPVIAATAAALLGLRGARRKDRGMTAVWVTIGVLAVTTALIRASGPVVLGGRDLPGLVSQRDLARRPGAARGVDSGGDHRRARGRLVRVRRPGDRRRRGRGRACAPGRARCRPSGWRRLQRLSCARSFRRGSLGGSR